MEQERFQRQVTGRVYNLDDPKQVEWLQSATIYIRKGESAKMKTVLNKVTQE